MFERIVVCHQTVEIGRLQWSASGQQHHERYLLERADDGCNQVEHHYDKETYEYFCKLPLDEQERYFNENLDLRYYKDDSTVGLTNDKYLNAKHAEEISRRTGKPFTDRYKVY